MQKKRLSRLPLFLCVRMSDEHYYNNMENTSLKLSLFFTIYAIFFIICMG